MKWRRYTKERDGLGTIVTGLVSDVLFPVAKSGWEVGGEEIMRDVSYNDQREWLWLTIVARPRFTYRVVAGLCQSRAPITVLS